VKTLIVQTVSLFPFSIRCFLLDTMFTVHRIEFKQARKSDRLCVSEIQSHIHKIRIIVQLIIVVRRPSPAGPHDCVYVLASGEVKKKLRLNECRERPCDLTAVVSSKVRRRRNGCVRVRTTLVDDERYSVSFPWLYNTYKQPRGRGGGGRDRRFIVV